MILRNLVVFFQVFSIVSVIVGGILGMMPLHARQLDKGR